MWARTWHQIFIRGEVIRKELTPFLAHGETGVMERKTEYIKYYTKQNLHRISIFAQWSLRRRVAFEPRWWWCEISSPSSRSGFLPVPDVQRPRRLTETNDCEQTAPFQITDICGKGGKDYLWKLNHHKANGPFSSSSSQAGGREQ